MTVAPSVPVTPSRGRVIGARALLVLGGPGHTATAARAAIAPALRRAEIVWGVWLLGMAVIVWILPLQVFRTTVLLIFASAIGFEVLKRQLAAEATTPDDAGGSE
jgi:hypothetical protein